MRNLLLAAFILLAVSLVWNTVKVIQKNYVIQADLQQLENEILVLELENQNLAYEIEYFKTDEFLELEARRKFNKAAPGEKVVYLPKESVETAGVSAADTSALVKTSNFDSWLKFLLGEE